MGDKLTLEEAEKLDAGICPDCGGQLYRGPRGGLALNVKCDKGHTFWVAPPFTPERLTTRPKVRAD